MKAPQEQVPTPFGVEDEVDSVEAATGIEKQQQSAGLIAAAAMGVLALLGTGAGLLIRRRSHGA